MSLPQLSDDQVRRYLARLGIDRPEVSAKGLADLQAAHLIAVPFHNLALLANDGRDPGLPSVMSAVEDNIRGIGGTCHLLTPPFAALLNALGFEVHLAAATVNEPGDHFVAIVQVDGVRWVCDVGNGHPYLTPWRLHVRWQEQDHHGWRFRFGITPEGVPTLRRRMPDGSSRTVYTVDPTPRAYEDFESIIRGHHTQKGFGPFLNALRAVRIAREGVMTLRDGEYSRYAEPVSPKRPALGAGALCGLLTERFELPEELVTEAVVVLMRRRPDLAQEADWIGQSVDCERLTYDRGLNDDSLAVLQAAHRAMDCGVVPNVLISVATIGREAAVDRLLDTLAEELDLFGYPGNVGVLLVDNSRSVLGSKIIDVRRGIPFVREPISAASAALSRARSLGIVPPRDQGVLPIGSAREAQLGILRNHLRERIPELPHPDDGPLVVWMLDDDICFRQVLKEGRIRHATSLFHRVARLWATKPSCSVALAGFTGDAPVPAMDGLAGQLRDLAAAVTHARSRAPGVPWNVPALEEVEPPDAYYDLAAGCAFERPIPWCPGAGSNHRDAARELLAAFPKVLEGRQVTRTLTWSGQETEPHASLRRGGNALYLDLDVLFSWPTPCLRCADGVETRRADTLWAGLAAREAPGAVLEVCLPLHHDRTGQGEGTPGGVDITMARLNTTAQARGVALSRAVADGVPVADALREREAMVNAHRESLLPLIEDARTAVGDLVGWSDVAIDGLVSQVLLALDKVEALARNATVIPGDPEELRRFLDTVSTRMPEWREAWAV